MRRILIMAFLGLAACQPKAFEPGLVPGSPGPSVSPMAEGTSVPGPEGTPTPLPGVDGFVTPAGGKVAELAPPAPLALSRLSNMLLAADGTLYGVVNSGAELFKRTPNGTFTRFAAPGEARSGASLALAPDGTLYATGFAGGSLWKYANARWEALDVAIKEPRGLDCDASGRVYVADPASATVWRYDAGKLQAFPGFRTPGDVSIDPKGTVYVYDAPVKLLAEDGTIKDASKDWFPLAFDATGAYVSGNNTEFYSIPQGNAHGDGRRNHGRLYHNDTLVLENAEAFVDGVVAEPAGSVIFSGGGKLYRFTPGSASATPPGTNP